MEERPLHFIESRHSRWSRADLAVAAKPPGHSGIRRRQLQIRSSAMKRLHPIENATALSSSSCRPRTLPGDLLWFRPWLPGAPSRERCDSKAKWMPRRTDRLATGDILHVWTAFSKCSDHHPALGMCQGLSSAAELHRDATQRRPRLARQRPRYFAYLRVLCRDKRVVPVELQADCGRPRVSPGASGLVRATSSTFTRVTSASSTGVRRKTTRIPPPLCAGLELQDKSFTKGRRED